MLFADMSLALEPAWPGLPALVAVALLLAGLTVWTYVGVKKATRRRVVAVVALRLLALAVAFSMMMRPSFAVSQLDGVDITKLLVIVDASESMNVAEIEGMPSRWEQVTKLWASPKVQRRLEQLKSEQKIEVVKYLGAEDLRADEPDAAANGKRTDIGAWLHQLWQKHGHEKHLRGIVLFSDGGDNGIRFSAQEKARQWRGVAPIHAFGVGNPNDPKFRKDLALTSINVTPKLIPVKSKMIVKVIAQAPGFLKTDVVVTAWLEDDKGEKADPPKVSNVTIRQEKDQPIEAVFDAPEEPGEYKVTMRIMPHPDEANVLNNEISTFVQVIKEKINILWVDRARVYEPTFAIRLALAPEVQFKVYHINPPSAGKGDPLALYEFGKRHYDVIIIGDISAQQFSLGDEKVFQKINELVTKKQTGLLMLGGTETFAKGGWQHHKALMDLLPVQYDAKPKDAEYSTKPVQALPEKGALNFPFLKLDPNAEKNDRLWKDEFEPLEGTAPLGSLVQGSTELLKGAGKNKELLMAATRQGAAGHVVVFAGDSTSRSWLENPTAASGYKKFWTRLVFWLSKQEDQANQLQINLDKRRINANAGEILGFTLSLRGKSKEILPNPTFKAKVVGLNDQEYPVQLAQNRGTFQGTKEGAFQLVVKGIARDVDGSDVEVEATARFLVALDDIEMLRPLAEHESLGKIAANSEGRFYLLEEQALLQYLNELRNQVNRESRQKTTHWPDWNRLPASDRPRDQLSGLWNSFALVSFLLFSALLGGEWLLRRMWGLV